MIGNGLSIGACSSFCCILGLWLIRWHFVSLRNDPSPTTGMKEHINPFWSLWAGLAYSRCACLTI